MLDQITPLILTYNEAPNIGRTLAQLTWANDIVVVDSFSDDSTTDIVSGFQQARVYQRVFDNHRDQWNFGLNDTDIKSPWVLALDADYVLTDEIVSELRGLDGDQAINGYRADFIYCLNGQRLRSGIYPSVTVLYRRQCAHYLQDGHTHRIHVKGQIAQLRQKILHDDRKSLNRWYLSQLKYAELETQKLFQTRKEDLSFRDRVRTWRVVAPIAVLLHCLVIRGGVLDGWRGFLYAFQRSLAEMMLSLNLLAHTIGKTEKRETGERFAELVDGNKTQHKGDF